MSRPTLCKDPRCNEWHDPMKPCPYRVRAAAAAGMAKVAKARGSNSEMLRGNAKARRLATSASEGATQRHKKRGDEVPARAAAIATTASGQSPHSPEDAAAKLAQIRSSKAASQRRWRANRKRRRHQSATA